MRLLDYCNSRDWIVIGWIHTHPTFKAFLSSIDQHQQTSIQSSQPKAVAIVLDQDDVPFFFRMTEKGMEFCKACKEEGSHKHPDKFFIEVPVHIMSSGKRAHGYVYNEADVVKDASDELVRLIEKKASFQSFEQKASFQSEASICIYIIHM